MEVNIKNLLIGYIIYFFINLITIFLINKNIHRFDKFHRFDKRQTVFSIISLKNAIIYSLIPIITLIIIYVFLIGEIIEMMYCKFLSKTLNKITLKINLKLKRIYFKMNNIFMNKKEK